PDAPPPIRVAGWEKGSSPSPPLQALRAPPAASQLIHASLTFSLAQAPVEVPLRLRSPRSAPPPAAGAPQENKCVVTMVHFKNRYMVMEVFIDAGRGEQDPVILTQFNITKVIRDSIQLNFGECGLAASLGSLQVKYVNPVTKLCIIRASREDHQKVWAAITMVRCIGKIPVSFNLLDMSGSIRACKKAALECDEAKFEQYKVAAGDRITPEVIQSVQSCFEKIRGLES
ncbi:unnamed protein product, partial [Urochloa humidicola]